MWESEQLVLSSTTVLLKLTFFFPDLLPEE